MTLALPGGEEVIEGMPVQYRYEGDIFSGEKRTELLVVPALSVRVSPRDRDHSGGVDRAPARRRRPHAARRRSAAPRRPGAPVARRARFA